MNTIDLTTDLRVQTFTEDRIGMRVGMPEVIIKVTHIPTGRSAYGCGERSQHANRAKAIASLSDLPAETSLVLADVIAAVDAEPELTDEMPDEMFNAVRNDKGALVELMRLAVRETKQNINARIATLNASSLNPHAAAGQAMYQVWQSTDSCAEHWSWDDVDKAEYDAAREDKRRILYTAPQLQPTHQLDAQRFQWLRWCYSQLKTSRCQNALEAFGLSVTPDTIDSLDVAVDEGMERTRP